MNLDLVIFPDGINRHRIRAGATGDKVSTTIVTFELIMGFRD